MKKQLVSATKTYQPSYPDELLVDDKPNVGSFNLITSDGVARAIAGASGEVPVVTEGDNGKVLTAIYDEGGPAVEWADAPSGIPDMAGKDGKILGAVDNAGTMEAQWVNKPESNVTTSTKQFVVGVNGTGLPITVDCANASENTSSGTVTEDSHPVTYHDFVMVYFPLSGLPSCDLGANTATLTVPNSVSYADLTQVGTYPLIAYYYDSTAANPTNAPTLTIPTSPWNATTKDLTAGTYTLSGSNPAPTLFDDGILLCISGGGDNFPTFADSMSEEMATWTLSYAGSEVTGYTIKPTVIVTPGSDAAGKVLTVTDTQGNYGWQPVPKELPTLTGNAGKVLGVVADNDHVINGQPATILDWVNYTQIEVVSSMPASPTSGVLYIVTGA